MCLMDKETAFTGHFLTILSKWPLKFAHNFVSRGEVGYMTIQRVYVPQECTGIDLSLMVSMVAATTPPRNKPAKIK